MSRNMGYHVDVDVRIYCTQQAADAHSVPSVLLARILFLITDQEILISYDEPR